MIQDNFRNFRILALYVDIAIIHQYRRIQRVTLDVYVDISSNPNFKGPFTTLKCPFTNFFYFVPKFNIKEKFSPRKRDHSLSILFLKCRRRC